MNTRWLLPVLFAFTAACGVSSNTKLNEMTSEDWEKVCKDTDEEVFTCEFEGGSYDITFGGTAEECVSGTADLSFSASCEATYGDYEACNDAYVEALRADPCYAETPSECTAVYACVEIAE